MIEKTKPAEQSYTALILIVLSSLFAGSGQLLWKLAINNSNGYIEVFFQPWLYAGILLYVLATGLMVLAFRSGDLSVLFPILATSFIWVTILAAYLFKTEEINYYRGWGIGFIFIGCCLLGWQQKRNVTRHQSSQQPSKTSHPKTPPLTDLDSDSDILPS